MIPQSLWWGPILTALRQVLVEPATRPDDNPLSYTQTPLLHAVQCVLIASD
jgi:hypothetical protein